jgi:uncharacterized protein YbjT (DUF2867 family)
MTTTPEAPSRTTIVLGGTGKTGRRVAARLAARGRPVRVGSRVGEPRFDWADPSGWRRVLRGAEAAYVAYYPDLAFPGAAERIGALAGLAVAEGVDRLVLLSGRGEEEAQASEQALRSAGGDWAVVRSSWFAQNFSEHFLLGPVLAGEIALPAGDVAEPFVDLDDVADVAVALLTGEAPAGAVYEVTGPRLLTFHDAAEEISRATGREVRYVPVTAAEYAAAATGHGVPAEEADGLADLFARVLDGRNAHLTDGVRRALGRTPADFADFARAAAATGVWGS